MDGSGSAGAEKVMLSRGVRAHPSGILAADRRDFQIAARPKVEQHGPNLVAQAVAGIARGAPHVEEIEVLLAPDRRHWDARDGGGCGRLDCSRLRCRRRTGRRGQDGQTQADAVPHRDFVR
jgi:hypothetical protein